MAILQIAKAIELYNQKTKPQAKMTLTTLGALVIEKDMTHRSKGWYMSQWACDQSLSAFHPSYIPKICKALNVDANFLFGLKTRKNGKR